MASRSNGDGPRSYQCSASPTTGWLSSKLAVPQSQVAGFGFEMHVAWAAAADCEPFVFKTDGVVARDSHRPPRVLIATNSCVGRERKTKATPRPER
jgi:hypothetical protein